MPTRSHHANWNDLLAPEAANEHPALEVRVLADEPRFIVARAGGVAFHWVGRLLGPDAELIFENTRAALREAPGNAAIVHVVDPDHSYPSPPRASGVIERFMEEFSGPVRVGACVVHVRGAATCFLRAAFMRSILATRSQDKFRVFDDAFEAHAWLAEQVDAPQRTAVGRLAARFERISGR